MCTVGHPSASRSHSCIPVNCNRLDYWVTYRHNQTCWDKRNHTETTFLGLPRIKAKTKQAKWYYTFQLNHKLCSIKPTLNQKEWYHEMRRYQYGVLRDTMKQSGVTPPKEPKCSRIRSWSEEILWRAIFQNNDRKENQYDAREWRLLNKMGKWMSYMIEDSTKEVETTRNYTEILAIKS